MSIVSGIGIVATARQNATQKKMQAISDALLQYRIANDRLPCPADITLGLTNASFGMEVGSPGTCAGANASGYGATNTASNAAEGTLPVTTLGLPAAFMIDGWNNRFRYAVDINMTASNAFKITPAACSVGAITVSDANGNLRSTSATYALISHGANGHGAYSRTGTVISSSSINTNELTNCHCDSSAAATAYTPSYVQMDSTNDPTNAVNSFDDLVIYKERWQMQAAWDKPGKCISLYADQTGDNRIEVFDTANGAYTSTVGSGANLSTPLNMAIDSSGNIWIANSGTLNNIVEFNSQGSYQGSFGSSGTGNGQFQSPCCMTLDSSGNLWVTDRNNSRIQKFNISGGVAAMTWMGALGGGSGGTCSACLCTAASCPSGSGSGNGQFNQPLMTGFDSMGNFWVADYANSRVQEFDKNGNFIKVIADPNSGNPSSLTFDGVGNLWITDGSLEEINVSTGAQMANYSSGSPAWLGTPTGLYYDSNSGNLWVGDTANHAVEEMTLGGVLVKTFGSLGSGNGQFSNTNNNGIYPLLHQ